jgi:hypothetical protein
VKIALLGEESYSREPQVKNTSDNGTSLCSTGTTSQKTKNNTICSRDEIAG